MSTGRIICLGIATAILTAGLALGCGSAATAADPAPEPQARAAVAKIVFIGQQEACACTRERIDATWAELHEVLEARPTVPVERLRMDTQHEEAAPYIALRALMVAPGLYFLDADGQLVEMLQGELTSEQIAAALE